MAVSEEGRRRVVLEAMEPEIDGGRFPIKRVVGESVRVEVDAFADGHDMVAGVVCYRGPGDEDWTEKRLEPLENDRWFAEFPVDRIGDYLYTVHAWIDHFQTWRRDMRKRIDAGTDTQVDYQIGAKWIEQAARRAEGSDRELLMNYADPLSDELAELCWRYSDRAFQARYGANLRVVVERARAAYSTWYEFFPRSASPEGGRHGTLKDSLARLDYIAGMGFDVVYLPPIHPVGTICRKGKNNAVVCEPADSGSPWAIGGEAGGHMAIHPELGGFDDFRVFVDRARALGMEVALDIAFQCAPDHPWVRSHPSWFKHRPDGSIQYAENPPKKYQDIFPLDFESEDWRGLWDELKKVFLFWMKHGVRIFRVDNPHTKAFPFWEWLTEELRREDPAAILLSEAFTRPKAMYRLAKSGYTQSYTYFAWRNSKQELTEYFTELTQTEVREFFRPNVWPNTPDILTEYLQHGGRPAFFIRLGLAATLAANYGIYGPAYELCVNTPREPGSEEYLHSEKYEIRAWDLEAPHSLRETIARINQIRRENAALQSDRHLRFHPTDNDMLLCYSKTTADRSNAIVTVVNLDVRNRHSGWVHLDLQALGLNGDGPFPVHDLLGGGRFLWWGSRNYVELDPLGLPLHILRIR